MARFFAFLGGTLAALAIAAFVLSRVNPPPPALEQLAGVAVEVAAFTVDPGGDADPGDNRHRLELRVVVDSTRDIDACLAFTLDAPFGNRRLEPVPAVDCLRPRLGRHELVLAFGQLTDDDLAFPSHTVVWGIRGGECGVALEVMGVCVVEQAGTLALELPRPSSLPSFGPIGSFLPIFSFGPID